MRIVFMGSAELAVSSLQALLENDDITLAGVVSQPDRPAERVSVATGAQYAHPLAVSIDGLAAV